MYIKSAIPDGFPNFISHICMRMCVFLTFAFYYFDLLKLHKYVYERTTMYACIFPNKNVIISHLHHISLHTFKVKWLHPAKYTCWHNADALTHSQGHFGIQQRFINCRLSSSNAQQILRAPTKQAATHTSAIGHIDGLVKRQRV